MPTVIVSGAKVRCRPLLDAIGAQEWLEHVAAQKPAPVLGPRAVARWERDRMAASRRRNATERRLRPDEHSTWERWRGCDEHGREAIRAVLTDLPGKGER